MLDAPIPRCLTVDGNAMTVPLSEDAMKVIRAWEERHVADLAESLAPLGFHPYEMPPPVWSRYVTARDVDELASQVEVPND